MVTDQVLGLPVLLGRQTSQRPVRAGLIVVEPPGFDDLPCIAHAPEPVQVQALVPQPAVEALP